MFYLLYEIQKYIVIRHGRNSDPAGAQAYKNLTPPRPIVARPAIGFAAGVASPTCPVGPEQRQVVVYFHFERYTAVVGPLGNE